MSMDLRNDSGATLNLSASAWSFYLELTQAYGWKPADTLPPPRVANWDGGYGSNDGQRVTKKDAASLAEALERVLADANGDARQREVNRKHQREVRALIQLLHGIDIPAEPADDSIASAADLRALAAFFRAGSFKVH